MAPPQGMGREIGQGIMNQMAQASLSTELIYAFVIIIISLMIYFGTRELYNLTNHKGIKYFRLSFLFFAIAYFFRSIMKAIIVFVDPQTLREIMFNVGNAFNPLILFLFMYFSSMAIFFLLYSVMIKKWNGKINFVMFFNAIAVFIALTTILTNSAKFILLIHFLLFLFVAFIALMAYKESKNKKKTHGLYFAYIFLFIFWLLNILDILIPNAFQSFQLLIYLISLGLFLMILYKVLRKTA